MGFDDGLKKWKVFLSRIIYMSIVLFIFPCVGEYLDEFVAEFHISLPLASWAFTLMSGLSLLSGPFMLRVCRVFSYRRVSVAAGLHFGLLFIALGAVARNTTHVYTCIILSGIALGASGLSSYVELGEHFKSTFGMANTSIYLISSSLTIGAPLLVEYFKVEYGLRWTLILTGAITWHLVLAGFCLTTKKATTPLKNSLQKEKETDRPLSFLRSHPYVVCHFIFQTVAYTRVLGLPLFVYPFAISKGRNHTQAAILISMFNLGSLAGRLNALGIFVWKVMGLHFVTAAVIIAAPILVSMIFQMLSLYRTSELLLTVMAVTTGMSSGFETSWGISSAMDLSCKEHFTAAASWLMFFSGIGATFGGLIVGLIHDIRGSYDDVMALIVVLSGLQGIFVVITLTWKRMVKECYLQS